MTLILKQLYIWGSQAKYGRMCRIDLLKAYHVHDYGCSTSTIKVFGNWKAVSAKVTSCRDSYAVGHARDEAEFCIKKVGKDG
jgi:hypothetical protein